MERLTTSIDQHGRMLVPLYIREKFNIRPGEKVTLEIDQNQIKIVNADYVVDEMYKLFTKKQKLFSINDLLTNSR